MSHTKQTTIEMYSHLYGKEVTMDDRFETKVIWSEELAIKNNGKWIPKEVTMSKQTALQWYIEQCENIKYNPLEKNGYTNAKEKIIKQALEMEKEQSISDYCAGFKASGEGWNGEYGLKNMFNVAEEIEAEKYYQETYVETKN